MKEIFHRTSIRKFEDKPVEQEKVEQILRAAMAAPSARNQQPWEFYVVTNQKVINKLAETSPYAGPVKNAPLAIVSCYKKDCLVPQYAEIDLSIATENILLMVDSLGLGAVMIGIAPIRERMDAVNEVIQIAENLEAFTIIPIGYPAQVKEQEDRYEECRVHYIR